MKKDAKIIIIFMTVTFLGCLAARAEFTDAEWQKMKKGEVVVTEVRSPNPDGTEKIDFLAKLYVKAPREECWKSIRDNNHYGEFMPNCKRAEIEKKEGETYFVRYEVRVWIVDTTYYLIVEGVDKYRYLRYTMDTSKKSGIANAYGYWILEDAPDGSGAILSYSAFVDPGIWAPQFVIKSLTRNNLPLIIKNVRMRVESGGTWKKPEGT